MGVKGVYLPIEHRFWSKVDIRSADECWNWVAYKDDLGYGKMGVLNNKISSAHRVSWTIHFGEIPDGMLVCHKCDNPSCVNPVHLFLGTAADNNKDRHQKGRTKTPANKGEQNPHSLLTAEKVLEIRNHIKNHSLPFREIAKKYGIALNTVYAVKNKRSWKNV